MNKYKVFRIIKILFSFLIVVSFFGITIKTTGFDEDDEAYGFEGTVYSKENKFYFNPMVLLSMQK